LAINATKFGIQLEVNYFLHPNISSTYNLFDAGVALGLQPGAVQQSPNLNRQSLWDVFVGENHVRVINLRAAGW